jgi:hypothetical protein
MGAAVIMPRQQSRCVPVTISGRRSPGTGRGEAGDDPVGAWRRQQSQWFGWFGTDDA